MGYCCGSNSQQIKNKDLRIKKIDKNIKKTVKFSEDERDESILSLSNETNNRTESKDISRQS